MTISSLSSGILVHCLWRREGLDLCVFMGGLHHCVFRKGLRSTHYNFVSGVGWVSFLVNFLEERIFLQVQ